MFRCMRAGLVYFLGVFNVMPQSRPQKILLAASMTIAFLVYFLGSVTFYGDSQTFEDYAAALIHLHFLPNLAGWREPGYPLLYILTGTLLVHQLTPLLLLQTLMAGCLPLLILKTLNPVSGRLAMITATASVVTLLPFNYQLLIYHDSLHLFLLMAFIACLVRYGQDPKIVNLQALFWIYGYFSFCRPTYLSLYAMLLLIGLLPQTDWKRFIRYSLYVLVAHLAFGAITSRSYEKQGADAESVAGRQLFYNVYLHSYSFEDAFWHTGPFTSRLDNALIGFFGRHHLSDIVVGQNQGVKHFQTLYGRYESDPTALVRAMFSKPQSDYFWTFWALPGMNHDDTVTDQMFLLSSLEQLAYHPRLAMNILVLNLKGYFWGPMVIVGHRPPPDNLIEDRPLLLFCDSSTSIDPPGHGLDFRRRWQHALGLQNMSVMCRHHLYQPWRYAYMLSLPILTTCVLIGQLLYGLSYLLRMKVSDAFHRERWAFLCTFWSMLLPQLAMAILVDARFRYQCFVMLPLLMSASISLFTIIRISRMRLFQRSANFVTVPI